MIILEANNLKKTYKTKTALDCLSLKLNEGSIYGILGKNGAGKSTFIKISLGLVFPTSGEILVFNKSPNAINNRVGYLPENISIFPHLSAFENIDVVSLMANTKLSTKKIKDILEKVSLGDTGRKLSKDFSLGMKRRLQLAMTMLIKEYEFIILDEPTNGLDISGMVWLKDEISNLKKSGVTILLASHSTKEMEDMITDYFIIGNGNICRSGKWDNNMGMRKINGAVIVCHDIQKCIHVLKQNNIKVTSQTNNSITTQTNHKYSELIKILSENGIFPENIKIIEESLQDIYVEALKKGD